MSIFGQPGQGIVPRSPVTTGVTEQKSENHREKKIICIADETHTAALKNVGASAHVRATEPALLASVDDTADVLEAVETFWHSDFARCQAVHLANKARPNAFVGMVLRLLRDALCTVP